MQATGAAPNKSSKPAPVLRIPEPDAGAAGWVVLGLDPSLSRTGYSLLEVSPVTDGTRAVWAQVGSIAPDNSSDPVWVRSKAIALAIRSVLFSHTPGGNKPGLIISAEQPTPHNDFLASISKILHVVLLDPELFNRFASVYVLHTNASTLRSLMELTQRGAKNKKENIEKAYSFIDRDTYPNLDTDACDAVLMAMMGRHAASVLAGYPEAVPPRFLLTLCDGTPEVKGAGRNARIRTRGILHRPEYWYRYAPASYAVECRNARERQRRLERKHFTV